MSRSDWYTLDKDKNPVPLDFDKMLNNPALQMSNSDRQVAHNTIGKVRISTVFLQLDHQWGEGPPLVFETMIFGGEHDQYQERFHTWVEAEEGHKRALLLVEESK